MKSVSSVSALLLLLASPALAGDGASGSEAEQVGPSVADSRHRPAGCDACDVDNPASSKAQAPPAARFSWPQGVRGALSISFDDARESQVDHRSAALFKERGIRVTYFVSLANVEKKQDLWRAVAADGHEIGNHSVRHPCSGNFPWIGPGERALENYTLEKIEAELLEANRSLRQMVGVTPVSYAYPCGLDFVGRGENRASYVPVVARHFLVGRGYRGEYFNNPAFCDLAMVQALGVDRDGHVLEATPFRFAAPRDAWYDVTVESRAPRGAAMAVVQIGFDSPNLFSSRQFRLRSVAWAAQPDPPQYAAEGQMISRPQRMTEPCEQGRVCWQAETPEGTSVGLQVRSAADCDGGPREWTPFAGPDGTPKSQFTSSGTRLPAIHAGHHWFQYRLTLGTSRTAVTPIVRQVRLGDEQRWIEDLAWPGADTSPPQLLDYTPRRTPDARQPFVFSLSDGPEGVGVDRHSVEAFLDGAPITAQLERVGTAFRYEPREPLQPVFGLAAMEDWSLANYNSALTIHHGPPRAPGGGTSIEVRRQGERTDTSFTFASPALSVQAGATYQVAIWSRHTMDLREAGSKEGPSGSVRWLDDQGNLLGNPVRLDLGGPSPQWRQTQLELTAPPGAHSAVMRLGWDYPDIVAGDEAAFADPLFDGPHPESGARPNLHRVLVTARDFAGNACEQLWWISVQPPPESGVTAMRDDGVILVDGQPLFPIGLYSVWKREHNGNDFNRCFTELREAGFNTIHTYHAQRDADLTEFYAAAARHGLRVIIAPRGGANSRDPQNAVRTVIEECRQPALLAWYLADDTASHISADELRRVHRAIRDVDPFHVTVQADGVFAGGPRPSRYTDYVDSTDAFLPEIYPIRSDQDCEVAHVTRDMKLIGDDLRRSGRKAPIWAIIQDFEGWGWQRYPTEAETRVMTYLAIIHGANGITYYTYGGTGKNHGVTHDPQVWAALKRISRQLADLHDVLVQRDPPQKQQIQILTGPQTDGLGYPAVSTLLKEHHGRRYLLAANSSRGAVRARVNAGVAAGQVQVLFEDRRLTAKAGVWDDDFAPYAVHVYAW